MKNKIAINNLYFAYDKKNVIDGVSLNIDQSEIVGILGPNGAGKSTLIKLMAGLLTPKSGEILFNETPIQKIPLKKLAQQMALVPQENIIPFSFKAFEIVLMGRTPHLPLLGFESKKDLEIACASMKKTDSLELASFDINSLSGGERQRVILARALAQEPCVLMLDEPTTFLDIKHQIGLHKLLHEENREKGLTVISAMHDLNLASNFCDRLIILKDGKIVADGKPEQVITNNILKSAFEVELEIIMNQKSGKPYCVFSRE